MNGWRVRMRRARMLSRVLELWLIEGRMRRRKLQSGLLGFVRAEAWPQLPSRATVYARLR